MVKVKDTFTPEEFVKAWQTSETVKEVKDKLNVDAKSHRVSYLAGFLRTRKVPLKKLFTANKYDYPNLIKLAQKYLEYGRVERKRNVEN